jgi:hypothetical protein
MAFLAPRSDRHAKAFVDDAFPCQSAAPPRADPISFETVSTGSPAGGLVPFDANKPAYCQQWEPARTKASAR